MNNERLEIISSIRRIVLTILSWIESFIFTEALVGSFVSWGFEWVFFISFAISISNTIKLYEDELKVLDRHIETFIMFIKK